MVDYAKVSKNELGPEEENKVDALKQLVGAGMMDTIKKSCFDQTVTQF